VTDEHVVDVELDPHHARGCANGVAVRDYQDGARRTLATVTLAMAVETTMKLDVATGSTITVRGRRRSRLQG
jgi:hypothetical protein